MDDPIIRPVGVSYGGESTREATAEAVRLRLSRAANLSDLRGEYEFYSDALLYLGVRLGPINPWADFLQAKGQDIQRISLNFGKPIFQGLNAPNGDRAWNHVLYGMPKEHWEKFLAFMGSLAFHDRELDLLTRLREQRIIVADPLYFEKAVILPDRCPTVAITAFVLDTNKGSTYFKTGDHPLLDLPRVVRSKQVFEDTEIFSTALKDEHAPDPYGAIDRRKSELAGQSVEEIELEERVRRARESDHNAANGRSGRQDQSDGQPGGRGGDPREPGQD